MNIKDAEQCIKEVFGPETKVFPREDFISGQKRVLRPLEEGEDAVEHDGRYLVGEKLVILGTGKTWEDALRGPVSTEMGRRRALAAKRAAIANHEGEMFALFLRELYHSRFEEWRLSSPLAKEQDAAFEKELEKAEEAQKTPAGAPRA
jgi:hypothetical protein